MTLEPHDIERLQKIKTLCEELDACGYDFRCDRPKMMEIISLTGIYGSMEPRRSDLVDWFKKYEKFRRKSKKQEAWRMATNSLRALSTVASSYLQEWGNRRPK